MPAIGQSDVLPVLPTIDRLIDTIPESNISANGSFTRADIDHVVIRRRDGQSANRRKRFVLKKRSPGLAAVGCLPHSAGHRSEIIKIGFTGDSFDGQGSPSSEGSHQSPLHTGVQTFVDARFDRCFGAGHGENWRKGKKTKNEFRKTT